MTTEKLIWKKTGRIVRANGETTTIYEAGQFRIESRKRAIPHANRSGIWYHTTYFLITEAEEKEYWSLRDAKAAAERREPDA